ncbi:MAG: elongation factor G [Ruminococcaceae bacterium]|nr:elongation factor G [Oscillospiraceae bacterium]
MKLYDTSKIRNFCLLGHGNSGKTSLAEAMLYTAGSVEKLGRTRDGNTATDFDPEEIKRKFSISTAVANCDWGGMKFNIIDTPGFFDFVGEVQQGIRVADAAIIVLSGKSGLTVGAEKAWNYTEERKLPKIIFINKVDDERVDYYKVLDQLREKYGKRIAPFQIPIREGDKITGFVNVVEKEARKFQGDRTVTASVPDDMAADIEPIRNMINEAVAESSEELMDRFFAGEEFTLEETYAALRAGVAKGEIVPVLCGSAYNKLGISSLMNAILAYFPSADTEEYIPAKKTDGTEARRKVSINDPLAALVFKTVADPYVGKLSYFKVYSGTMTPDTTVYNPNKEKNERIGKIFALVGKKQTEVEKLSAGDIGAVAKLAATETGDTLCSLSDHVILEGINFVKPNMSLAVVPKAKGDEEKISQGLARLMEEDKTFIVENNVETHQQVIKGLGDQHIDILVSKLKNKFGVEVSLEAPKVPYREAIRKAVKAEGKHKKQSGGHGQYGHVWIEFEPCESETLIFEEKVFGGSVPKNYFPAVEKGLQDCMQKGVLAGYPVVNLKATLVDGSYHPVDSSEMAFKTAAGLAFKSGLEQASPVLLEPIGHLKVMVPDTYTGDIIGDINKRRGQMLGMTPQGNGDTLIEGEIPVAEMYSYANDLRSMTQGRGEFEFEFERYQEAPQNVADKVIAENN